MPLTAEEVHVLAGYNGERARGLVHTKSWRRRMAELQERFDQIGYQTDDKKWWRR